MHQAPSVEAESGADHKVHGLVLVTSQHEYKHFAKQHVTRRIRGVQNRKYNMQCVQYQAKKRNCDRAVMTLKGCAVG